MSTIPGQLNYSRRRKSLYGQGTDEAERLPIQQVLGDGGGGLLYGEVFYEEEQYAD